MGKRMTEIQYINRETKKIETEKVWKEGFLKFLYGKKPGANLFLTLFAKSAFVSSIVGLYQKSFLSKKNIKPFIDNYTIDAKEFQKQTFTSFNDFFIRKLKPECRPIAKEAAIIPADGRYLFFKNVSECPYLNIKGEKYNLGDLLQDEPLAKQFKGGTAIIARLCPTDYHRFHFPIDCTPSTPKLINGYHFSVNPIALKRMPSIFFQNKRVLTMLKSKKFGNVAMIEVGATSVGTIKQTFTPNKAVKKGDEKGYFSFGGSSLILLFPKGKLHLKEDLLQQNLEIRCLFGQALSNS
jgi:phosphatidylserine decarboxylase